MPSGACETLDGGPAGRPNLATIGRVGSGGVGLAQSYLMDELVYKIAKVAGCPDELPITLTIEQAETLFDQLAARSEGSSSSQVGIPDDPRIAATLVLLRELMQHLHFDWLLTGVELRNL